MRSQPLAHAREQTQKRPAVSIPPGACVSQGARGVLGYLTTMVALPEVLVELYVPPR